MRAAIVTVGTELVRGEVPDANGAWLAARVTQLGFRVQAVTALADDREALAGALRALGASERVVVVTGGLGPAPDDVTAAAAADAAGVGLTPDPMVLELLRRKLLVAGRELTPALARTAELPEGCEVLGPPVGVAPSFRLRIGRAEVYFLPGDPDTATRVFDDLVARRIVALGLPDEYQIVLRTCGLPESAVGERLAELEGLIPGLRVGYRALAPEVDVRLSVRAPDVAEARALAERAAVEARTRLGGVVFGDEHDTFSAAVGRALRARGLTLALAESCTGGLLGAMLTAVPGASDYLLLDAVVYSNRAKERVLGVPSEVLLGHGAVSLECVRAMAEGARRVTDADLALAVSGVAGPGGGSAEKPVGLVHLCLASASGVTVKTERYLGDRARVQRLAAFAGLGMIRDACRGPAPSSGVSGCG
ncbi:MAG: CinA family nicotinamide mononucleotide deamidase-related protein [Deltaproteobacteria bacterium]|nr:CinA family nicotinamide mononucleotide deamidase-related protein [Deltaproteobacteria bacterium]